MHIKSSTLLCSSSLPVKLLHRLCSSIFSSAKNVCLVPTTLPSIPLPFQSSSSSLALLFLQSQPQDLGSSVRYAPPMRSRIVPVLTSILARSSILTVLTDAIVVGHLTISDSEGTYYYGNYQKGCNDVHIKIINDNFWLRILL